MLAIIPLNNQL